MIIPRGSDATRSYNPDLYPGTLHLFINVEKKYFVDLILRHLLSDRVSNSLHHVLCSRVNCEPRTWTHSRLAVKGFSWTGGLTFHHIFKGPVDQEVTFHKILLSPGDKDDFSTFLFQHTRKESPAKMMKWWMEIEQYRISKTRSSLHVPYLYHRQELFTWPYATIVGMLVCIVSIFTKRTNASVSQVLLYIVFLSHLVQRKAPQTFTPIIFSHSAVSPSANLDTTLSIILSKNSQVNQGNLVFCSPVNGGNIGSIVHQDIDSLGKGFQRCVKKILNCSSVCDVSFNHQGDAILLSNLELQFTQLFFGSDKKQ